MIPDTNGPRIGIFGGSFDPVHTGHLLMAEQCREALELDQILFIPAAVSPLKQTSRPTEDRHRLQMLQLAIGGNPAFHVDDRELRRGGISYTVDTLRELQAEKPTAKLFFLMGADSLADLDRWKDPAEICRLAFVAVVARGGQPAPDIARLVTYLPPDEAADSVRVQKHIVPVRQVDISSSAIRRDVQAGKSIRYQVPASVAAYIEASGLYRSTASGVA